MTRQILNLINGQLLPASDGSTTDVVNPATGKVYAQAAKSSAADVDSAFVAASNAFVSWSESTPAERSLALYKFADAIEARSDELVAIEVENTGKPTSLTASEEIPQTLDCIRFFAGAARSLEGKSAGEYMRGHTSWIRREPIGVVGQITPWNYPMLMAAWKFGPALAAGNCLVLKPSDTTPASTVWLAELAQEFFPPGVFNVVCGDRDTGRAIVEHSVPGLISITGSVRAGMEVAQSASSSLKRVHLELGGKAPVVVFGDVDIVASATAIAGAGLFNAGQDCVAATRVLVAAEIHDEFLAALTQAVKDTKTGQPNDADVYYGALNNESQLARVAGMLERTPSHATIQTGGKAIAGEGYFFEPTVVSGLKQTDELIQSEIFGPVLTVQSFTDEANALVLANDVKYALAASIWTKDHGRAMRMSAKLDFGCVWINTHLPLTGEMPHGGFKHSGYGKDLSMYGLEDYTRIKHVMSNLDI